MTPLKEQISLTSFSIAKDDNTWQQIAEMSTPAAVQQRMTNATRRITVA